MSSRPRLLDHPDHMLVMTTGAMVLLGLVMILSASYVEAYKLYGSSFVFFNKQVVGAALGAAAGFLLSRLDYRRLRPGTRPFLFGVVLLLLIVLIPGVGLIRGGSSRWISLGPLTLQPSEAAKLGLVLFAAHVLDLKQKKIFQLKELAVPVIPVTGLVCLLIVLQPDLGTAIVCATAVLVVMYLAGARPAHMVTLVGLGGAVTLALALTEGYRRARLFGFLDPWADPTGAGWQPIQGQIALGSGGLFGLGLGASRQKWSYVPNAHTDFIYAILGEELGLVGTLTTLAAFVLLFYLGVRIARRAPDRFGMLVAGGITGWLGVQTLVNMGAVTGFLPITGVPLPIISFGGSSLLFTLAAVGILLSIARASTRRG